MEKDIIKLAKDAFFEELFYELGIETIFMRIRNVNIRSQKAAEKLPYTINANESRKSLYEQLNATGNIYQLFEIPKDLYTFHVLRNSNEEDSHKDWKPKRKAACSAAKKRPGVESGLTIFMVCRFFIFELICL